MTKKKAMDSLKKRGDAVYETVKALHRVGGILTDRRRQYLSTKYGVGTVRTICGNYTRGYYQYLTDAIWG